MAARRVKPSKGSSADRDAGGAIESLDELVEQVREVRRRLWSERGSFEAYLDQLRAEAGARRNQRAGSSVRRRVPRGGADRAA